MGRALFVLLVAAIGLYFLNKTLERQSQLPGWSQEETPEELKPSEEVQAAATEAPPETVAAPEATGTAP